MKDKKQQRSLIESYTFYTRIPAIALTVMIVINLVLVLLDFFYPSVGLTIAIASVVFGAFLLYIVYFIFIRRKLKRTFYDQIYKVTLDNLEKIRNNDTNLVEYGESDIKEINTLSEVTSDVSKKLNASFLIVREPNYESLNLEYVDKERNLISYKTFKENLSNIIFLSQSFRNVLIEVFYDFPTEEKLRKDDQERLLNLYRETFSDHDRVLYMFAEDEKSLLIYVPVIDSFTEIREKLSYAVTESSVTIRDDRGIRNILAKYAVVAYPYSSEEMMLGDLRAARRQSEPYTLFLPQRARENINKNLMLNSTMNANYTSKILVELNKIDYSVKDNEKNKNVLRNIFNEITDFLDVDEGGIVSFDRTNGAYYSYVASRRSTLFKQDVSKDLIEALAGAVDDDNSYYFSTKRHASGTIKRVLDMYGINSGTYFVVRSIETHEITALVYMFNREKDLKLNTYLREMFYVVSIRIENYFDKREIADFAQTKMLENDSILALSHLYSYHIDDEFRFTEVSKSMKNKFPNIKLGETCHKFFFGNEKPCKDCPLRTNQKKYFEDRGLKFESSLVLWNRKDKDHVILTKQLDGTNEAADLFHPDILVYSFKALVDLIKSAYAANGRGYIVLLTIDNYEQIVAEKGSEGYAYYMREYVRTLKNRLNTNEIYVYNPTTLAIHLPYEGHANTINKIESIYPLSKANFYSTESFKELKVTYLPIGYPRGYANPENFIMHMSEFYNNPQFERGKDFIYFADYSISRSANKREFMVSVLESEFSGHNSTSMHLQPIVTVKDSHIFGAEILLRIEDTHRNTTINALEISRIAEEEGKTQLVTNSIINFIGNMYREYGKSVFKINKFNRIAINIDQTYLGDDKIIEDLAKLSTENDLPKGFISLEIPEDVIPNNKDKIKHLAEELSKFEIFFSCDRYMGQYVDIEELKNLGFNEVKVALKIVSKIDKDPVMYDTVRTMVSLAQQHNINVAAVGVENEEQAKLLKQLDENAVAQGYYYYKDLSRSDLIEALISYEK